jgi:hypothetical protein
MSIGYDNFSLNSHLVLDVPHFEGLGFLVRDLSKYRINMTVSATTVWTTLASGKVVLTYGGDLSGDFLQCSAADSGELDFTSNDFTLMAWIYPLSTGGGSDMIMCKSDTDVSGWEFYITIPNLKTVSLRTNQAGSHVGIEAAGVLTLDTWQLVTVTRIGVGGQFYVNNLPVSTNLGTGLINPVSAVARKFLIGIQHDETNNCFEGMMTGHKAWSRALSASEIAMIFGSERYYFGV